MATTRDNYLETQIEKWRVHMRTGRTTAESHLDELEDDLRSQIAELTAAGLSTDEAFLIAVKRTGDLEYLSRHLRREPSDQLLNPSESSRTPDKSQTPDTTPDKSQTPETTTTAKDQRFVDRHDLFVMIGFAVAAGLAIKAPEILGKEITNGEHAGFYLRNSGLLVLPLAAGYFAWKRALQTFALGVVGAAFVVAAIFANIYPFEDNSHTESAVSHTETLTIMHLPVLLWLVVGVAYTGGKWRSHSRRMDYVRFTGEWFIYYVLIALGGGVLTGLTAAVFSAIGLELNMLASTWLLPCGATGACIVAAWLAESRQTIVENIAPVLTKVFTPLFATMLVTFLLALAWTRTDVKIDRDVLLLFDVILIVVIGLLLYAISARDPHAPPSFFDWLQLTLAVSALLTDLFALASILTRVNDYGLSANRTAALGLNIVLLANLAGAVWLYIKFLRHRQAFNSIEQWQTSYLNVYAIWAVIVVVAFPPLFDYI